MFLKVANLWRRYGLPAALSTIGWLILILPACEPPPCPLTDEQCMAVFQPFLDRYYPIFAPAIGGRLEIRLKTLKSLWGVCRPAKRQITLNRRLAQQPLEAVEYCRSTGRHPRPRGRSR